MKGKTITQKDENGINPLGAGYFKIGAILIRTKNSSARSTDILRAYILQSVNECAGLIFPKCYAHGFSPCG